ncbi:MAG TPA: tetratricopeptide repeat protein, partial [Opitutus sp.]|nr:tetratricopeptide repeat protein [Opitutus sp.]
QPNDASVYSSLGLIQRRQGRWAESLENLRRAIELDPANVGYLRNLIASLIHGRRWDDLRAAHERLIAIAPDKLRERMDAASDEYSATGSTAAEDRLLAELTPAQRETPVALYYRKGWALHHRDYVEFKRLDRLQPAFPDEELPVLSAVIAGGVYQVTNDPGLQARIAGQLAEIRAQVQREPANTQAWSLLASLEGLAGNKDDARRLAQHTVELMPESRDALDGPIYRFVDAAVAAMVGDKDRALAGIAHVLSVPAPFSVADLRASPACASLRGDPRFEALLADPKNNAPLF